MMMHVYLTRQSIITKFITSSLTILGFRNPTKIKKNRLRPSHLLLNPITYFSLNIFFTCGFFHSYSVTMEGMTNLTTTPSNGGGVNPAVNSNNNSNNIENGSQNGSTGSGRSTPSSDSSPGKLFVGGLSWQTTPDKLRDYFGQFGTVTDVLVMKDPVTQVNTIHTSSNLFFCSELCCKVSRYH